MTIITKTIGRLPVYQGDYDSTRSYSKKMRVTLYGSEFESKHDNNNTAPAIWDGADIVTFNTTDWQVISNGSDAWLVGKEKPATTGTTGNHPFNGMGRVVLKKNIQTIGGEDRNILIQDMFCKDGPNGTRVPNNNTVYVVQYDFSLSDDIIIPNSCMLKFEGGTIENVSGNNYSITFNNTTLSGNVVFNDIPLIGTVTNKTLYISWTSGSISKIKGIDPTGHIIAFDINTTADTTMNYSNKSNIVFDGCYNTINVPAGMRLFAPEGEYSNIEIKNFVFEGTLTSNFFDPDSGWNVIHENIHIHHNTINTCGLAISLNSHSCGETRNSSVHDNIIKMNIYYYNVIGHYGIHLANANYINIYNNYISGSGRHAIYLAWGHDVNISNNVLENNNLADVSHQQPAFDDWRYTDPDVPVMIISRYSQNINVYGNKFLENGSKNILISRDTDGGARAQAGPTSNVDIHDNIFVNNVRRIWFEIEIGSYDINPAERVFDIWEENIKIHDNIMTSRCGLNNAICIVSGKGIEITNNHIIWDKSENFVTEFGSNVVFNIRQKVGYAFAAQDLLQDFTIQGNKVEGRNANSNFTFYLFYVEDLPLNQNNVFIDGLIKDNIFLGIFKDYGKWLMNNTVFPKAYDIMLKSGSSNTRPQLTVNTPTCEYYDGEIHKNIYWEPGDLAWLDEKGFSAARSKGTTSQRPVGVGRGGALESTRDIGFEYYDTTIGRLIYASYIAPDGVVTWKDALGNNISSNYLQKSNISGLVKNDGSIDTNTYIPVIANGSTGNIPKIKADGALEDSGRNSTDIVMKSGSVISGHVPEFDGTGGAIKDSGKPATNIS